VFFRRFPWLSPACRWSPTPGFKVLTGFMDALGFGALCEDRLGQFVPAGATHRPGRLVGSLAAMLARR
jgi:hypothetical protein